MSIENLESSDRPAFIDSLMRDIESNPPDMSCATDAIDHVCGRILACHQDLSSPNTPLALRHIAIKSLEKPKTAESAFTNLLTRFIPSSQSSQASPFEDKDLASLFLELLSTCIKTKDLALSKQTLLFLLDHRFPAEEIQDRLSQILTHSCSKNDLETVRLLYALSEASNQTVVLEADRKNSLGQSSFHLAVLASPELLSFLLTKQQTCLEIANREGNTALHLAVEQQDAACIQLLLEAGANPNAADAEGNTPLHILAKKHQQEELDPFLFEELFSLFLSEGADLHVKNDAGVTPAMILEGEISGTSLERLLSNANGIADQEMRSYEGLHPSYPLLKEIESSLLGMPEQSPLISQKSLADALKTSVNLEEISSGKLTIMKAGWPGHAIYLVFSSGYLIICNRGSRLPNTPTLLAYKIDASQLTKEEDLKILCPSEKEGIIYFYQTLPNLLKAEKDDLCKTIETLSNKEQKVGNCPMTIKSALRAASFLLLHKQGMKIEEALKLSREFSKAWSTYFRMATLSRYLNEKERQSHFDQIDTLKKMKTLPKRDEFLIKAVQDKLRKRNVAPFLKLFPFSI